MKKILAGCALGLSLLVAGCAHPVPLYPPPPPPPVFDTYAQHGYFDGFNAAQRDIQRSRRPRIDRHERFRNPPVPPPYWQDYRQGFRTGYETALHPAPPR